MKSAIRIAYDNLAEVVDRDNELLAQWTAAQKTQHSNTLSYGYPPVQQTPEDEVREALRYQHIRQLMQGYETQINHQQVRLDIAKRIYEDEYLPQIDERRQCMMTLFKMLTQEEQDEIMLDKLSR